MSSLTVSWWLGVFALFQLAFAKTTILFFQGRDCTGNNLVCGNINADDCCFTSVFQVSASFVTSEPDSAITVYSEQSCSGSFQRNGGPCIQPTFGFKSGRRENITSLTETEGFEGTKSKDCRRPNRLSMINYDGEEVVVNIPDGKNDEFEEAFAKGDVAGVVELSRLYG